MLQDLPYRVISALALLTIACYLDNLILVVILPPGETYHGIHMFFKGHWISAVIVDSHVLLVCQIIIMRYIQTRKDVNAGDPLVFRIKVLA